MQLNERHREGKYNNHSPKLGSLRQPLSSCLPLCTSLRLSERPFLLKVGLIGHLKRQWQCPQKSR